MCHRNLIKKPCAFENKHNAFSPILHNTTGKKDIANAVQAGAIWQLQLNVLVWTEQDVLKTKNRPSPPQTNLK